MHVGTLKEKAQRHKGRMVRGAFKVEEIRKTSVREWTRKLIWEGKQKKRRRKRA